MYGEFDCGSNYKTKRNSLFVSTSQVCYICTQINKKMKKTILDYLLCLCSASVYVICFRWQRKEGWTTVEHLLFF